jgi:hypothetical protein
MKFNIIGADRESGQDVEMTIEAANESAAEEVAHRKGIMVSRIAPAQVMTPPEPRPVVITHPMVQGHYHDAPIVNVALPRRGNSLGVAALVLGIIAFLICWIPFVNLLGMPLSALGLLLGLIGVLVALTRKGTGIGYPIAGSAVSGLALFIAIVITGAFASGIKGAADALTRETDRRNATNQTAAGNASSEQGVPITAPGPSRPAEEWAPADVPVRQGDVQVRVVGVRVGKVPLRDSYGGETGQSRDVLLMIEVELTNLGETRKVEYRTWGGRAMSFGTRMSLTDNFGNRYKVVNFGLGDEVGGSVESGSIYPAASIRDVLVFEQPIGRTEHLNLELPATQFGGEGMIRIRIPASMIRR